MQRLITVREAFHSNIIGPHAPVGSWLTDERLRMLTLGMYPKSSGFDEAKERGITLLAGQVKLQAYTLAFIDGFITIAWVCVGIIILIALMKPMKIYYDSQSFEPPK